MTQTVRISDALRCILLNAPKGPNLACPKDSFFQCSSFGNARLWKESLVPGQNRITLLQWDTINLKGLVSARVRQGNRAWEIDRLHLPLDHAVPAGHSGGYGPLETVSLELLEQLAQSAAWRSAERIFLRLPSDSAMIPLARRSGFFPYLSETLLEGQGDTNHGNGGNGASPDLEPRRRLMQDSYGLFQLFSATTPATARMALGLTHDQWQDAQELSGKGEEWVIEKRGRIAAWLGVSGHGQASGGSVMVHPDHPDLLPGLVSLALSRPGPQRWLVPDYQEMVIHLLRYRGFHEVSQYIMLIKTVAAPVASPGMAPVEA